MKTTGRWQEAMKVEGYQDAPESVAVAYQIINGKLDYRYVGSSAHGQKEFMEKIERYTEKGWEVYTYMLVGRITK